MPTEGEPAKGLVTSIFLIENMMRFLTFTLLLLASPLISASTPGAYESGTLQAPTPDLSASLITLSPYVECLNSERFAQSQADLYGIQLAAEASEIEVIIVDENCNRATGGGHVE